MMSVKKIYPDVWGRGALFAFSGLDGTVSYDNSMCGQLLAQHVGMAFDKEASELYLRWTGVHNYTFSIVASDIILGTANESDPFGFLFVNENTMIGFCNAGQAIPIAHADLLEQTNLTDGVAFCGDGVSYALVKRIMGETLTFAFSRGKDKCQAGSQARQALETDVAALTQKKLAYFDCVPEVNGISDLRKKTLAKTFSLMKSQVYTAEGSFRQRWTTPDRLPHRKCWLWDSVFHALGNYYIDPQLAYDSIASVLDVQQENGFIPHMFWPTGASRHTQVPVLAWGLNKLYQRDRDIEKIAPFFPKVERFLQWIMSDRDVNQNGLFEWYVNPDIPDCRCGESGCDNSPRFDHACHMDAIDFSSFMASEYRAMRDLSKVLGKPDREEYYDGLYRDICKKINEVLFDPVDGRYYDREVDTGNLRKISSSASFIPLFAGVCTEDHAACLVNDLKNPETFGTAFGIPSISRQDPVYGTDMWRGPVWININYFIIDGLRQYGYTAFAEELLEKTLSEIERWYEKEGVAFEYYDCEAKLSPTELARKVVCLKPIDDTVWVSAIRDYGWSNTLYASMVMERYGNTDKKE